jgi:hypothetical protein
MLASNKPTIG